MTISLANTKIIPRLSFSIRVGNCSACQVQAGGEGTYLAVTHARERTAGLLQLSCVVLESDTLGDFIFYLFFDNFIYTYVHIYTYIRI